MVRGDGGMANTPMDYRTVLIVEDEDDARELLARALHLHGYIALQARNGRGALDQIDGGMFLPALILVDLDMPNNDGFELLQRLANKGDEVTAKVIVITRSAPQPIPGTIAMLQKPLELPRLLAFMHRLLRQPEADGLER
jgi:DNA-binding response OmpR family regulator